MMQKNNKVHVMEADDNSINVYKFPGSGDQNQNTHRNKSAGGSKRKKGTTRRKKRRFTHIEEDAPEEQQQTLNNKKLCIICGNSQEIVDLSANPIMKKTMASYCEGDGVNLDECLSSLCITCVFKSRAVREVQNNIKVRLQGLGNGQLLKTSQCSTKKEENLDISDYNEDIDIGGNIRLNNNKESRLKKTRTNGLRETTPRLPTAATLAPSPATNSPTFNHLQYTTLSKCIGINTVLDSSMEDADNKNTVQLTKYRLTEISGTTTSIQQLEAKGTEYNPAVTSSLLSTERIELLALSNVPDLPTSCSNSTHSHNGINQSMLQVIRERSESVLITESGGKINNYKNAPRAKARRVCRHCGNTFMRKDHYNKHVRRCCYQNSRSSALLSADVTNKLDKSQTVPQVSANRKPVNSVNRSASPTPENRARRIRQFHCTECQATMDTITLLRQHRATHLREYKCDMCYKKFSTLYEHDFHRIVCLAEKEVWQEQTLSENEDNTANDDKKSVVRSERSIAKSTASRRLTRAQSRARTDVVEKPKNQPTLKRRLTVLTSVSRYVHSNKNSEDSDMDDDDDDDVSIADSMDSRRRVYTGDWLERRNDSIVYDLPDIQIDSAKEYDLYLLDRLKAQIRAQEFTCLTDDCDFFTDTLLNLMLHDYVHHFKSSWFYCQKCGSVFTSKVFLDYHLDRQNGGRYICYKCNEQFMFQHQLDLHLIYHTKQLNHTCDKCKCEFLSEEKLALHTKLEHSNETDKNLICIQSKATYASSRSPGENEYLNGKQRKKYNVKILNMRLPYMPSRRPLQLPGHKPYRRRIGVIEFENERNPNCCSCK